MLKMALLCATLAAAVAASPAAAGNYYVAKTGNDANSCLSWTAPCLTVNGARAKMPSGRNSLGVGPGVYEEQLNVFYNIQLNLYGATNPDGTCAGLASALLVTIRQLWTQDGAILWANCIATEASQSRQGAIVDYTGIAFLPTAGVHVIAGEASKQNCAGTNWIVGSAPVHALAGGLSTILLYCQMVLSPGVGFSMYFAEAWQIALIDMSPATFVGTAAFGKKFYNNHSQIAYPTAGGAGAVPGLGSDALNFPVGE